LSHIHNHSHVHSDDFNDKSARFIITIGLNFLITLAEIIGGIFSGSLSLISDALHNFSDGIAVILSYFAIRLGKKPSTFDYTFGFKRAEIIVAVFNSAVLIGISLYLIIEAADRLVHPSPVEGKVMLIVATIGFIANVAGTLLLKKGSNNNMNIRSAYLHLLSDAVSSLGVILGGLFIYIYEIYWLDPLLTFLISIYIMKSSYSIVKESIGVLMMGTPPEYSIPLIENSLTEIDDIKNVHHVHLWRINENQTHFEAHVEIDDILISHSNEILNKIELLLNEKFNIQHITIQFECDRCGVKKLV